jgi:hypothetical protein
MTTYQEAEALNLGITQDDMGIRGFLNALPHDSFQGILASKFRDQVKAQTGVKMTVYDAIDDYRDFITNYSKKPLGSANMTLNGAKPDDSSQEVKKNSKKKKDDNKKEFECPCGGGKHDFVHCRYLCESVRPSNWTPNPETMKKMQGLMSHEKLGYFMKKAVEEDKKKMDDKSGNSDAKADSKDSKKSTFPAMITPTRAIPLRSAGTYNASPQVHALSKSFILDSGATVHVCNDLARMIDYREAPHGECLSVGDTYTQIEGYGTVVINAKPTEEDSTVQLTLQHVCYCPGFHLNLVSLKRAMRQGVHWLPEYGVLYNKFGNLCRIEEHHDMFTVEYNEVEVKDQQAFPVRRRQPTSYSRPTNQCSAEILHQRMGHPYYEAMTHFADATTVTARSEHIKMYW